jgi:hypothetical protein
MGFPEFLRTFCVTAFAGSVSVFGQHSRVSPTAIEMQSWTITPLLQRSEGAADEVVGFLAVAKHDSISGRNLSTLWYARTPAGWHSFSWKDTGSGEAVAWLKESLGLNDNDMALLGCSSPSGPTLPPSPPTPYSDGLLVDDPLHDELRHSPDRDELIALLVNLGYPAADIPLDWGTPAIRNATLDSFADAVVASQRIADDSKAEYLANWVVASYSAAGVGSGPAIITTSELPVQFGPWDLPQYSCETVIYPPAPGEFSTWCTTQRWTETQTVTQQRIRTRFIPPSTYVFCYQSRAGVRVRTTTCTICRSLLTDPPVPCPTDPLPQSPVPEACLPGWTRDVTVSDPAWGEWVPPCSF